MGRQRVALWEDEEMHYGKMKRCIMGRQRGALWEDEEKVEKEERLSEMKRKNQGQGQGQGGVGSYL